MKGLCKKMKKRAALFLACLMAFSLSACAGEEESTSGTAPVERAEQQPETESEEERSGGTQEDGKILVVYFSATGNTEAVANYIANATGGDLFELEPADPYTDEDLDYNDDNSRVSLEYADESLRDVELVSATVDGFEEYSLVCLGYPLWWGGAAWPVNQFVESNDFTGKTVIPFCTSASSGMGDSGQMLEEMSGTGNWLEGQRFSSSVSEENVRAWIEGLGL